jgi:DNA-binding transcriptional ArsR family regulator
LNTISEELLDRIAVKFRAMANPVRLKILHALEEGELSVTEILARIGGSQANASKHLGVLRGADLVSSRREGVSVFYQISDPAVFVICDAVCDSLHERATAEIETIERGRVDLLSARG